MFVEIRYKFSSWAVAKGHQDSGKLEFVAILV
jgi:hypothetical protein